MDMPYVYGGGKCMPGRNGEGRLPVSVSDGLTHARNPSFPAINPFDTYNLTPYNSTPTSTLSFYSAVPAIESPTYLEFQTAFRHFAVAINTTYLNHLIKN
ncbi:hypothetical protein LVJ85_03335 [Neisseria sp. Dent CA1/247]|uniref:hypothetical protein n=1 Tax=Neisseria sp. Dent CA1/247 TaxID=2912675 RepID=UPI001FD4259D|nr:hypothetical protein [Neisseria sp. Dent CA1/247]UOO77531.1 hypothetical protein LVJ85_03335 [Neisseria sp. Dent CA1/247]